MSRAKAKKGTPASVVHAGIPFSPVPVAPGTSSTRAPNGLDEAQDTLARISKGLMMVRQIASLRGGRKGQGRGRGQKGMRRGAEGELSLKKDEHWRGCRSEKRAKRRAFMGGSMGTSKTNEGERAIRQAVPRSPRCCRCVARPAARPKSENLLLAKNTTPSSGRRQHSLIAARPADDRSIPSAQCSLTTAACARCQIARPPAPAGCFLDWANHHRHGPRPTKSIHDSRVPRQHRRIQYISPL